MFSHWLFQLILSVCCLFCCLLLNFWALRVKGKDLLLWALGIIHRKMLNRGQVINWGALLSGAFVLPIAVIFSSRPSVPLAKVIARSGNTWRKSHHIWHAPPQWGRCGRRSPWALKTRSKPTAKNAFAHYEENLNKLDWKISGCLISEGSFFLKKKKFTYTVLFLSSEVAAVLHCFVTCWLRTLPTSFFFPKRWCWVVCVPVWAF